MLLEILKSPDPRLRQKGSPVEAEPGVQELVQNLKETLLAQKDPEGVGLAATQVGRTERVIIVRELADEKKNRTEKVMALLNPQVLSQSFQTTKEYEGCLSVPGYYGLVSRAEKIKVTALEENGRPIKFRAEGLLARTILHEIDHLEGILFTDRAEGKLLSEEELDSLLQQNLSLNLRIVFFGSSRYSTLVAESLHNQPGLTLALVVSQEHQLSSQPPALEQFAQKYNLKHLRVAKLGKEETELIAEARPDFLITADFGLKIPPSLLQCPRIAPLNVHPSLLPKYRGPAPGPAAILQGERESGITIIQMDAGFDTGAVIAQERFPLDPQETAASFYQKAYELGAKRLHKVLLQMAEGKIVLRAQDNNQATYTSKISKVCGRVKWEEDSPDYIERMIRAYYPWPGAWTTIGELRKFYLKEAYLPQTSDPKRLKLLKGHLREGKLELAEVQIEGKKPISWRQFQAGHL